MHVRERLHRLIDVLPDDELERMERVLVGETNGSNGTTLADAPYDDEPLTPEDVAALSEARADIAAGRVVSHEEARHRLLGSS